MEVRAIAQGYYDLKIRNEGQIFEIKSEKEFSKVWMEKIGDDSKPAKASAKKATPKEVHQEAFEKAVDESKDDVI